MAEIQIAWVTDWHECETCGLSYAEGAKVTIDGAEAISLTPVARCYDGDHWTQEAVYIEILKHLGHEVSEGAE